MKRHLATALVGYGSGFHFSSDPPRDVADVRYLRGSDPYDTIACVLANLHQGTFEATEALLPLLKASDEHFVWSAATDLLAYGAPQDLVRRFFAWAYECPEDSRRCAACSVALMAGNSWAIEPALDLLPTIADLQMRTFLRADLSWLLEASPGPLSIEPSDIESPNQAGVLPWQDPRGVPDEAEYATGVRRAVDQNSAALAAAGDAAFAEGEPMDVSNIAQRLLERLEEPRTFSPRLHHAALQLEASTGLRAWECFAGSGQVDRARLAAIILRFLDSDAPARFAPGTRYFFGHRIPG